MADQKDHRITANSTSPRQVYAEGQLAITDADNRQRQADARLAEQAVQAAKRRSPSTKNMSNSLDSGDFGGNPFTVTPAPTPKPRVIGKKGK